jgi:hypothetical protein
MWTNEPPKPSSTGITGSANATASDLRMPPESSRVLIVGRTLRAGKTTISLSIALRGGQFVADEYVFLE